MQCPFGNDEDDIDLEKLIRRIDKHSAAQCSVYMNTVVPNFNLYSEARSTDATREKVVHTATHLHHEASVIRPADRISSPSALLDSIAHVHVGKMPCGSSFKVRGNDMRELEMGAGGTPTKLKRRTTRGRLATRTSNTSKSPIAEGADEPQVVAAPKVPQAGSDA
jgi:hypothetical protein